MLGLVIFPILFFIVGFLFKVIRPYYTKIEFVLFNVIVSVIALIIANASMLFLTFSFFVQMMFLHVGIYLFFSFMGLGTQIIYSWMKERFRLISGITGGLTMLALVSVMMTACFSIQYLLTLIY